MKANYLAALVLRGACCNGLCVYMLIPDRGIFSEKIGRLLSASLFKTRIKSQNLQCVAIDAQGLKQGFEGYVFQ